METYGLLWRPGKPSETIVFEVAKYSDFPQSPLESEILEFYVSRQFLLEFKLNSEEIYSFKVSRNRDACVYIALISWLD